MSRHLPHDDPEQPPERVALRTHIDERVDERGMNLDELADASGLHPETIRRARRGTARISTSTRKSIETALAWAPGSINAILAGGQPMPLAEESPQAHVRTLPNGAHQLWLSVRSADGQPQQMMIPLDLESVPGLDGLSPSEVDMLTHQMLGVMVHAGRAFLEEQGRQRTARATQGDPTIR
ncbi:helix-turn-helix transcriptional regulator [Nocardiopsis tropica]|uniref:helix-turn-helix domain-containing protein n=1 Tax=Nocardiopsis tropica TaxID=109330 RepID=UPI002E89C0F2|nr:helix-turn-helix transcriptional regulator [Nocardiopsis tropica]